MKKRTISSSGRQRQLPAAVEEFAKVNGQILLPPMELVTQARVAIDEVVDRIGRQLAG